MEPGCTKSGAKIEKNALNRPKWLPDGSQDPLGQSVAPSLVNFGAPSGTQTSEGTPPSTKNHVLAKKGAPRNAFLTVFVANAVFLDFWKDL